MASRVSKVACCANWTASIGVGGRQCKLPVIHPKTAGEFLRRPHAVFCWKHHRDAATELRLYGVYYGGRAVTTHRPRITETEINVDVIVHVD